MKATSRCGLGQTSFNPVLTSLASFRPLYDSLVQEDPKRFRRSFDLEAATAGGGADPRGRRPMSEGLQIHPGRPGDPGSCPARPSSRRPTPPGSTSPGCATSPGSSRSAAAASAPSRRTAAPSRPAPTRPAPGMIVESDTEELNAHREAAARDAVRRGQPLLHVVREERQLRAAGPGLPLRDRGSALRVPVPGPGRRRVAPGHPDRPQPLHPLRALRAHLAGPRQEGGLRLRRARARTRRSRSAPGRGCATPTPT